MNGRAPNSPETGSQILPVQNRKPNLSIESCEVRKSSQKMPATSTTTSRAKNPVPSRNPRSSALRHDVVVFLGVVSGTRSSELDLLEGFHPEGDDLGRKRRIA